MAIHATCPTCSCAPTRPVAGFEVPDHSGACAAAHRGWWRVWEAKGTPSNATLSLTARAAQRASQRCPACKAGAEPPGKGWA